MDLKIHGIGTRKIHIGRQNAVTCTKIKVWCGIKELIAPFFSDNNINSQKFFTFFGYRISMLLRERATIFFSVKWYPSRFLTCLKMVK